MTGLFPPAAKPTRYRPRQRLAPRQQRTSEQTAWAVYLGACTAERLARELDVSTATARHYLRNAERHGRIARIPGTSRYAPLGLDP